jgi:hypothetical protein
MFAPAKDSSTGGFHAKPQRRKAEKAQTENLAHRMEANDRRPKRVALASLLKNSFACFFFVFASTARTECRAAALTKKGEE